MRTAQNAPSDPCRVLERRDGLAEIVKRGVVGVDERRCIIRLRLPAGVVATQGAVAGAVGREVAAAAELGVLRHATHAVLVTGSTFSEVAMRWRTQSNQSAPVVVRLI